MRKLCFVFRGIALILSHAMCILTAWEYCSLLWCGEYGGCSAPAWTALLLAIPFAAGIAVCLLLARYFARRAAKEDAR